MPLIEIRARPGEHDLDAVSARISAEVAEAIGARPEAVWVSWSVIEHAHGVPGPIVHVYARRTAEQIEALTGVLERILGEDVFVTVQPVYALDPDA